MRAHLYKTLTDASGAILQNCTVRVLQPGTTTALVDTLWSDDTTTTQPLANPFTASNGIVNVYLDTPQRVRLGVTPPGMSEIFFDDLDVLEPRPKNYITIQDSTQVTWYGTISTSGVLSWSTSAP
jgi:hypothetical protein